jgi:hypothetical protein
MKNQLANFESFKLQNPQFVLGGGGKDIKDPCDDIKDPCSCTCDDEPKKKAKGNNGFGNGGDDPAPGNSGTNGNRNAAQKLADQVR